MTTLFFIYARRFAKELHVLTQIETDCYYNLIHILKRINDVFKDDPNLNDIVKFVNDIYESNQRLFYFDRIGFDWAEVSQGTKPEDVDNAICRQMCAEMTYSNEKTKEYQKKY